MSTSHFEPEAIAQQLGADGVDNLVANAERVCGYEQTRIELTNQGTVLSLRAMYNQLLLEEHRLEDLLKSAPPSGDMRRLRRRAIFCWTITVLLTGSGLALTLVTLAPYRFGWMSWLFAVGIAVLTPFLVEKLLEKNELLVKIVNAIAAVAAVASLMFLADVRGNLLSQEIQESHAPVVILDDSQPQPEPENNFFDASNRSLHLAMLLLAFSLEVGSGLALREAWRSAPDSSEDWKTVRMELIRIRQQQAEVIRAAVDLRNAPGIFVACFWRDFYRAMLTKAVRSAMTKLPIVLVGLILLAIPTARAEDHLNLVVAIDLTRSEAAVGPDGKSEFQKNIDGVTLQLLQVPAGTHLTVIGITDHSFAQPYILLSAHIPDDPGYFGERLNAAHAQLAFAWKKRAATLDPHFQWTDIFGAVQLAPQIFAQQTGATSRTLVLFSDMRESTPELNLERLQVVPPFSTLTPRCEPIPALHGISVRVFGADGATESAAYWTSLRAFWSEYFQDAGANLQNYVVLSDPAETPRTLQ